MDRFGLAELDSPIPRQFPDNVPCSFNTVLEYVLRPLQELNKCGRVDMELHERYVTANMTLKEAQQAQGFKEYQMKLNAVYCQWWTEERGSRSFDDIWSEAFGGIAGVLR